MGSFLSWILFGLIVGVVANMIEPGRARGGALGAIVLGIVGAIVGGYLGSLLFGVPVSGWNLSSFVVAVAGSLLLLVVGRSLTTRA
jgi:uncharacterized membrane protein YeaQ/YmgE (transglycosylase-associated protein family)